jgi:hypothetical protein
MSASAESSNWEYCKARSSYHFSDKLDLPGEWFKVLGQFKNTWADDLAFIKDTAKPMTWENRKFTMGRNGPMSPMLAQEEADILAGGGNPKMELVDTYSDFAKSTSLQAVIDFFGLNNPQCRVHVQRTGQVFNYHMDKAETMYPTEPTGNIVKLAVMLEDWQPGHFYQYGNLTYEHWKAGECHVFDWYNAPHCTANASNKARYTLHITGLKTDRTDQIIDGIIGIS